MRSKASAAVVAAVVALALLPITARGQSTSASPCSTTAGTGYSVTLCITAPATGSTVSGNVPVTTSVTTTGTSPGLGRIHFFLGGAYVLTDREAPFSFSLMTARRVDGTYPLEARAVMNDSFEPTPASVMLTLSNGVVTPPTNSATFSPRLGTQPADGQPFVVAAVGDAGSGRTRSTQVANTIASMAPNLVLYAGDVYDVGSPDEYFNWYGPATEMGRFRNITNPSIGNHEYGTPGAAGYFDYWDNVPNYYSYDTRGWHFVHLDTTSAFGQKGVGSPQYEWLRSDLARSTSPCTIAVFHHPRFSRNGGDAALQDLWSLMARSGVDIVINGHSHNYQRYQPLDELGVPTPSGMTQFIVGTGGAMTYSFGTADERMAAGVDASPSSYGALRLALRQGAADFSYRSVAGATLDPGTVSCNSTQPPPLPPPTETQVFSPSQDATVRSDLPTTANGSGTTLAADADPTKKFFIRFPLAGLAGREIVSAKLRLYNVNSSPYGGALHRVTGAWNESTITHNTAPGYDSSIVSSLGWVPDGTWQEFDVTSLVTGDGALDVAIDSINGDGAEYSSREGANAPQLVVRSRALSTPPPSPTPTPTSSPSPTPTTTPSPTPRVLTFTTAADATVKQAQPATNFGASRTIDVDGDPVKRTYMRFSVAGTNGRVSKAVLRLYNVDPSRYGGWVHGSATTTWLENTITWANAPPFGASVATIAQVVAGNTYDVDVTSLVKGDGPVTLVLTSSALDGADYSSRQGLQAPRLIVTTP